MGESCVQFFWVLGLCVRNFDLVYPICPRREKAAKASTLRGRFSLDLCARRCIQAAVVGAVRSALGGLREGCMRRLSLVCWTTYSAGRAEFVTMGIFEYATLMGTGPSFCFPYVRRKGRRVFPETFGGGLGIERTLFALCWTSVKDIDELTCFGKIRIKC